MKEVNTRGIPELPQIYPLTPNAARARVPDKQAEVKLASVAEIVTVNLVSTVPLFTVPAATEVICVQRPETYWATLISARPLAAMRGVRSLWGSHAILIFAEVELVDLTVQYSPVLVTFSGACTDVAVGFGVKNSTVNGIVENADDVTTKECPFIAPLPRGKLNSSPRAIYFVRGPLM